MKRKKIIPDIRHGFFKAPSGWCAAAWTPKGLAALVLPRAGKREALRGLHEYLPKVPAEVWEGEPSAVPMEIQKQSKAALRGKAFRYFRFDLFSLTAFQQRIFEPPV